MTWVRRDDHASIHRKVAPLDDATYRLWSEAIEWCSRNLTDGHIAADELPDVSKRASRPRAAKLVERDLWHAGGYECPSDKCPPPNGSGWVIHDYFDYNPTKVKVKAELAAKAERTRQWRERKAGRHGDAHGDPPGDASRDVSRDASGDGVSIPSPSPPRPAPKEGGARAPRSGTGRQRAGGAAGPERKPGDPSPRCERCGNPLTSNYHRRHCAEETAA